MCHADREKENRYGDLILDTPLLQNISHSINLEKSYYFKFDQNYKKDYKDFMTSNGYIIKKIFNKESNDTYLISLMLVFLYKNLVKFKIL